MATKNWDAAAVLRFGESDQTLTLRSAVELKTIQVPGGMTPRELAGIVHAFDGYTVDGFGYEPMQVHPEDCVICDDAVNDPHWYIGEDY